MRPILYIWLSWLILRFIELNEAVEIESAPIARRWPLLRPTYLPDALREQPGIHTPLQDALFMKRRALSGV